MAKLSEQKKVELLEAAIVANDIETVKSLYALAHGYLDGQVLKRRMEPIIDKKQLGASEDYYENIHAVLSWMEKESQKRKKKQVRENAI